MATTTANITITAQDRASIVLSRLTGATDKLQTSFDRLNAPLLRAQSLWASLVGGAIIGGITSLVKAIDDLDEAAQGLGTTAVNLAAVRQAGSEAGIGVEKLENAIGKLNVQIAEAAAGDEKTARHFQALGIAFRDMEGNTRDSIAVLGDLADLFKTLPDGPAKTALAVERFGEKLGRHMIPLLNLGSEALARNTGLTEETVKQAALLQTQIDKLAASYEKLKFELTAGIVPALNDFVEGVKRTIANVKAVDWSSGKEAGGFFADLWKNSPAAQMAREAPGIEMRNRAIAEGLKLSGAEAVNANRGAQSILDMIRAIDREIEARAKKNAAIKESSNAYAQEFRDVQRIRAARQAFSDEQEAEANRRRDEAEQRLQDLTGRSAIEKETADLKLLDEALAKGQINIVEYSLGLHEVFGKNSAVTEGMKEQTELAQQLGLTISSSLGELITSGGKAGDVFKALGQDIAKLLTQLLILKPLAAEIMRLFEDKSGGSSTSGWIGSVFNAIGGLFGSGGAAAGGGAAPGEGTGSFTGSFPSGGAASAGPQIVVNVGDATDRARVALLVEQGVKAGLAASWDSRARGGSGVLA